MVLPNRRILRFNRPRFSVAVVLFMFLSAGVVWFSSPSPKPHSFPSTYMYEFGKASHRSELPSPRDHTDSQDSKRADDGISLCRDAVNRLTELNVQLIALDFDNTIVEVHTGGNWEGSLNDLARHVRPEFKCLVQASIERDVHVAVVTFSKQEDLISKVLKLAIPPTESVALPVRGGNNYSSRTGKRKQLHLAVEDLFPATGSLPSPTLSQDRVVLIDDDNTNVKKAKADGYRAILFDPENPKSLFRQMKAMS